MPPHRTALLFWEHRDGQSGTNLQAAQGLPRPPNHAIVTLTDARTGKRRDYWLGEFGSRQSRERYHRLLAAWESGGRVLPFAAASGGSD